MMAETQIIRVVYPLQDGSMVLRVDGDWDRTVEATRCHIPLQFFFGKTPQF